MWRLQTLLPRLRRSAPSPEWGVPPWRGERPPMSDSHRRAHSLTIRGEDYRPGWLLGVGSVPGAPVDGCPALGVPARAEAARA